MFFGASIQIDSPGTTWIVRKDGKDTLINSSFQAGNDNELLAAVRLFPLHFDGCLVAGVTRIEFREQGEFLL